MKLSHLLILINFLISNILISQKYDFKWLLGYHEGVNRDSVLGHVMMDFNTSSGNIVYKVDKSKNIDLEVGNGLSMSDRYGNFLFSFNGFYMEDMKGNKVFNSDSICYYDECYASLQQSVILPYPTKDSIYSLFTIHDFWFPLPKSLRGGMCSYIPIILNKDTIINLPQYKSILFKDTLDVSKISACKHANGRDWWILVPIDSINSFYTILLTPFGPSKIFTQQVNDKNRFNGDGLAFFSPNGKYFALTISSNYVVNPNGSIELYSFDRCTGLLSNNNYTNFINYNSLDYDLIVSGAFSPNSKYLYACESDSLFQFAISKDGKLGPRILIDVYDGFKSYLFNGISRSTKFRQLQLAPDGKIYCNPTYIQTREFGVINEPNREGKACNFKQHSLMMPTIKYSCPTFPNYRLGPIDGSNCDTLGIDNIPWCWWRYNQDTSNHLCFEFTDLSAYEVAEWYWSFGDGTQSRDTSPIHCFPKNGIYEVCLIVKNKYGADTLCRTLNIGSTGIIDVDLKKIKIELFPNPVHDDLVINLEDYIPERMEVQLINLEGSRILKQRIYQGSNVINVEELVEGVYLVNIFEQGVLIKSEKMIKY